MTSENNLVFLKKLKGTNIDVKSSRIMDIEYYITLMYLIIFDGICCT